MKQPERPGALRRWLGYLRDAVFWRDRDLPARSFAPTVAACQQCGQERQLFLWGDNALWCRDCIDKQLRR